MKNTNDSYTNKRRRDRFTSIDRKIRLQRKRRLNQLRELDNPLYFGHQINRLSKELENAEETTYEATEYLSDEENRTSEAFETQPIENGYEEPSPKVSKARKSSKKGGKASKGRKTGKSKK